MDYFLPTVVQSYEFNDNKRQQRQQAALKKIKKQSCLLKKMPNLSMTFKTNKKKCTALEDLGHILHNSWKDDLPPSDLIQLHSLYKVRNARQIQQHPFELVFSAFQYRILDASQVCKEICQRHRKSVKTCVNKSQRQRIQAHAQTSSIVQPDHSRTNQESFLPLSHHGQV